MLKATKQEKRRWTRWLGRPSSVRNKISLEFEMSGGVNNEDLCLMLELADAVALAARQTHDVGAVRLLSMKFDGEEVL